MVSTMVAYYHKKWSNSFKALEEVDGVQVLADEASKWRDASKKNADDGE